MRADRLLSLILRLQTEGKQTAQALASELGVSRRTILRDVEALSLAGIPIYSEGGHGGGIALDEQYRTSLTGLHTSEVRSLFVASNSTALDEVGLGEAGERLLLKLLAALPAAHRPTVDHIRQRLMVDPAWWWRDTDSPPFWDDLQRAVYEDCLIDATYERYDGSISERTLAPYSLVNKSSLWYLIALRDDEFRTYRVSRFHRVDVLPQTFTRRPDFDLPTYWKDHLQEFIDSFSEYKITLRVHPERVKFVQWLTPGRWRLLDESDDDGWVGIEVVMESPQLARMLVFGLGAQGQVIAPAGLAEEVRAEARALLGQTE